jgi:hypothetical protein
MMKRALWSRLLLCTLVGMSGATGAAVISVGAFPELSPSPSISIPADTFLVPVQVSGALGLQDWQFDLVFDNTVVEVVDPLDGSSGIYGAEFTPGDPDSLSFILGGFPFNFLGLVDDVAGSYPALLTGASGDGVLAYVLFQYLVGQENNDPGFGIEEVTVQQAPEPGTPALLAAALLILSFARHASTRRRTIAGVR